MADEQRRTALLSPLTAARMVWAMTGSFSKDPQSKRSPALTGSAVEDLRSRAEQDALERAYIGGALAAMDACLRNLDIIHKKRNRDFRENEQLRDAYFETVKDNLDFGNRAGDFLKSLPAVAIGGAGGLTLTQALGMTESGLWLWVFGLALAAAGYLVNLVVVRVMRRRKQMITILLDYEKGLYYERYLNRAAMLMTTLVADLDLIHAEVFGAGYPRISEQAELVLRSIIDGIRTEYCPWVHRHIRSGKVDPKLWPVCEAGDAAARRICPHWEEQPATPDEPARGGRV